MQKVTGKSKVRECFVFTIVAHFKHRRGQKCIFNICVLKSLLTLHQKNGNEQICFVIEEKLFGYG
jgi:hypothetical protein